MSEIAVYSDILQNFAFPILHARDRDAVLLQKLKLAVNVWNYCVIKKFSQQDTAPLDAIFAQEMNQQPAMAAIFKMLVLRKATDFDRYNRLIEKVELRNKGREGKTVYVESRDVDGPQKPKG